MFDDCRSRRVIFIAHCVLNQNAISDGTASFSGANEAIARMLLDAKVGIVQMPCPELNCLGLDRGDPEGARRPLLEENTRIRRSLEQTNAQEGINVLVKQVIFQMEEYRRNGFEILGVIGINRSPSCGVETTSDDEKEIKGEGVFLHALIREIVRHNWRIPIVGVKDSEPEKTAENIRHLLGTK